MNRLTEQSLPFPPHRLLHGASLFLDLDGTLIELAAHPNAVTVDVMLRRLLSRLCHVLQSRLVIVSGRSAMDLRKLMDIPSVALVGSHGGEILLPDGRRWTLPGLSPPAHILSRLRSLESEHQGVLVEPKPFGLALHYRLAPEAAEICRRAAEEIAASEGYSLQPGKKVIEIKYYPVTKGDAVSRLMVERPLKDGRPLFMGDDLTDEAGFRVATALGGTGILVGAQRKTLASYRLDSVTAALNWLEASAG